MNHVENHVPEPLLHSTKIWPKGVILKIIFNIIIDICLQIRRRKIVSGNDGGWKFLDKESNSFYFLVINFDSA
jgi:hypothetical protein